MTGERLKNSIDAYQALDAGAHSPVEFARLRENVLVEFLHALAAEHGKEIGFTRIDSRGEMAFNIVGPQGPGDGRPCGPYGEEIAELLSQVPTRTGLVATTKRVLPENGWCSIDHFDVERLVELAAARDFGAAPAGP